MAVVVEVVILSDGNRIKSSCMTLIRVVHGDKGFTAIKWINIKSTSTVN